MATRTEAYLDTSALVAFLDDSDSYHPLFRRLFSDPPKLVTTPLVVAEGHGWFLRRYDQNRALQFLSMLSELSVLEILEVGSDEQAAAARVLQRFSDQKLSLADALGLHVMHERKIEVCWSTDFHLGLTGVPLVIHQI